MIVSRARSAWSVLLIPLLAAVGLAVATPASAATASLTVNGTVVDSSASPVQGQSVAIFTNLNFYSAVTDASGTFSVTVEYDTNMGYVSISAGAADAFIDPASLGGATETSIVITLPETVTVTVEGFVTDAYGVPLAGTPVSAFSDVSGGDSATTDADGYYSVTLDAVAGGTVSIYASDFSTYTSLSGYSDGDVIRHDFTIGSGSINSIEIDGTFLDAEGSPLPFADVFISTDQSFWQVTTDENGAFVQVVDFGEFAPVNLSADHAGLTLDPADLLGESSISVVLQQAAAAHVTVEGTVFDLDGNVVADQWVAASGETSAYGRSDAAGHYSLSVLADPFAEIAVEVEDGDVPYDVTGYEDGDVVTQDVVVTGSGYQIRVPGPAIQCDVDGDGIVDQVAAYTTVSTGAVNWTFSYGDAGFDWREATFGQGDISAVYCADLNGDGASEVIAQGAHVKVKKSTGDSVTKNDWWIYDFTTDTATARTFPNGEISGVVFENLDDIPGVEMIVERLRTNGPNTFWVLDDASAEIEKFRVGFGTGGTLDFADIDGVAGTDIVTTKVKPNGTLVTEYYTRASGVGEIVKVKVKAS